MVKKLGDLTSIQINNAIEHNLFAWIPVLGRMGQTYDSNPPGVKRSITDRRVSLFNSIMDARLDGKDVDSTIQAVIADGQAHGVPLLWWTGPSTRPRNLDKKLIEHGFKLDEDSPGMALDLEKMIEKPAPPKFEIRLARKDPEWKQWSTTMAQGFEAPPEATFVVEEWSKFLSVTNPETTFAYTGWLDGIPVGVSLMILAAGSAGIYSVATIPSARGKGVGRYMTQYPLQQANLLGFKIGVLEASDMGLPVYQSLGFQKYCRISSYRWSPKKI